MIKCFTNKKLPIYDEFAVSSTRNSSLNVLCASVNSTSTSCFTCFSWFSASFALDHFACIFTSVSFPGSAHCCPKLTLAHAPIFI